jgi:hypothetical protein
MLSLGTKRLRKASNPGSYLTSGWAPLLRLVEVRSATPRWGGLGRVHVSVPIGALSTLSGCQRRLIVYREVSDSSEEEWPETRGKRTTKGAGDR